MYKIMIVEDDLVIAESVSGHLQRWGDEYIEKPFDINVLTAKIQALLRRTYSLTQQQNILSYGELVLNLNSTTESFVR